MKSRFGGMYQGQAIAIVMVILVVAAVLGASLYSRTLKNNQDVTDKEDSDVSLEQADNVLDVITSSISLPTLSDLSGQGNQEYATLEQLAAAAELGTSLPEIESWCQEGSASEASPSSMKITLGRTDPSEKIDVRVGDSRTFNFVNATITGASPSLNLYIEPVGSSYTLFTVKNIYKNGSGEVKDYSEADMEAYCIYSSAENDCEGKGIDPLRTSVQLVSSGTGIEVPVAAVSGYNIEEVKVIPLKGDLKVSYGLENITSNSMSYVKINVAVNCTGSYREKQVIFPSVESLGYPTIFDYTIYNKGVLEPS